jgi:hypothetical protein
MAIICHSSRVISRHLCSCTVSINATSVHYLDPHILKQSKFVIEKCYYILLLIVFLSHVIIVLESPEWLFLIFILTITFVIFVHFVSWVASGPFILLNFNRIHFNLGTLLYFSNLGVIHLWRPQKIWRFTPPLFTLPPPGVDVHKTIPKITKKVKWLHICILTAA